jgi:hypothetical protein
MDVVTLLDSEGFHLASTFRRRRWGESQDLPTRLQPSQRSDSQWLNDSWLDCERSGGVCGAIEDERDTGTSEEHQTQQRNRHLMPAKHILKSGH